MKMEIFTNEYLIKKEVKELDIFEIDYDKSLITREKFGYKVAAQVSRRLTEEKRIPVASVGSLIVAAYGIEIPSVVTVTMKIDGVPTDVKVSINKVGSMKEGEIPFREAMKKFLNRCVDLLMFEKNFIQDNRGFYETKCKNISKFYAVRQGAFITTRLQMDGSWTLVIDPLTQIKARLNLLQALDLELKRRGLKHWGEAQSYAEEINKSFRSRAFSLRSTYVELGRDGNPEYNIYKFIGFDFSKALEENSDPRNPVNFHTRFGRSFSMDQPVVRVRAKGGFEVTHIPELLEERPSLKMLKRFGVSEKVQTRARMDASTRYYMTTELAKPLVEEGFIEPTPLAVDAADYGPVRLTIESDYIELKTNYDFQRYFEKKKVLKKPSIARIHVFSTDSNALATKKLVRLLLEVFKEFKLPLPQLKEDLSCPENLDEFRAHILEAAREARFSAEDLVLVIFGFKDEDLENITYRSLKRESFNQLFPVQFVSSDTLVENKGRNLKKDVVNPLFIQIVAKCGGQPYGLQPGFAPVGTIFVGIDRYRNPFRRNAPLVTSVVFFDNNGNYTYGVSKISKPEEGALNLYPLLKSGFEKFCLITSREKWNYVLYLVDTGEGTIEEQLKKEAEECGKASGGFSAGWAFITANKGTHLRLYCGDPSEILSAGKVSPFTAAIGMKDPNRFLVVSTEPITSIEAAREYGTQRPVLYTVFASSGEVELRELKEIAAKSIVWLCRHSWVSPTSMRLPAPLYFANCLNRLTSATDTEVRPDRMKAPLFL